MERVTLSRVVFVWAALPVMLAACGSPAGAPDAGSSGGDAQTESDAATSEAGPPESGDAGLPPAEEVTYYRDVRPILARHCVRCHAGGGIAPFPLDSYEAARPLASLIATVTRQRIMPPYLADNSGACQTFRDAAWLSDREIEALEAWDAQGEPEGDPRTPPPEIPPPPRLEGEIHSISTGVDYVPDPSRTDDYRCFVVESPLSDRYYVTGYEVHPGNASIVHHVIVYAPQSDDAGNEARERDAREEGPGYTCFGSSHVDALPVVLWAPGGGATLFPAGTGLQIDGSRPLIIQVHYNTLAGAGSDRTRVDLQTARSAIRAFFGPLAAHDLALPPRMESVTATAEQSLAELPVSLRVWGTFPHMHTLGRSLQVDRIASDGTEQCLVRLPRWDFRWQLAYWYETPFRVTRADTVRITCTYDTRSRTETTYWGEGTLDEMCLNFFYVTPEL
jgi:hypothetical protein